MKLFGPPGSRAIGQANVNPNPSSNNSGHAPSLERHAATHGAPRYASHLEHYNGNHQIGGNSERSQGARHSPLSQGFMNRGFHAMEQTRKSAPPITGAGRGVPNPHQDHQRAAARAERQGKADHPHAGGASFHPPHSMHPDTVKEASRGKAKSFTAGQFGNKSMVAQARKAPGGFHGGGSHPQVGGGFHGGKPADASNPGKPSFRPAGHDLTAKPQDGGAARSVDNRGTTLKVAPHTAVSSVMPQNAKAKLGLPTFASKTAPHGVPKPQPARPIAAPSAKLAPIAHVNPIAASAKPAAKPAAKPTLLSKAVSIFKAPVAKATAPIVKPAVAKAPIKVAPRPVPVTHATLKKTTLKF